MANPLCCAAGALHSRVAMRRLALFLLVLSLPIAVYAQTDHPLVKQLAEARIAEERLGWEKKLGRLTQEEYRARYKVAHAHALQMSSRLGRLPKPEQDQVRQAYLALYKVRITPLVNAWEAELQAAADARNARKRDVQRAMERDAKVAGQLQAKRTRLAQQLAKGEITEAAYRQQDGTAESQILAMANKYVADGYAATFSHIAAVEAERFLKQPPPKPAAAAPPAPAVVKRDIPAPRTIKDSRRAGWWWVAGFGAFVGFLVWRISRRRKPPVDPAPPLTDNYGSAAFAPYELPPEYPGITAFGVFLGKRSAPQFKEAGPELPTAPVATRPEYHTLIVGRTRTGKGTRVIVPTLLRYFGSMFVIDPKGENAAVTARIRRDTWRQTVHIVNPWGVLKKDFAATGFAPATYNPLDILDRDDPNAVATAQRLANAICPVTGRGDDLFWQQSAATILAAVFLWLADQPGEKKTLARAREIVTLSRKAFTEKFLTKMAVSTAFSGAIREMVGNLLDLADNTYTGITANLTLTTAFISDPQLKKATNASTFDVGSLRDTRSTVYLVIPPDQIDAQKTWLRLMIAAATQSFRQERTTEKQFPCMMLIDEFPALGKLTDLPTDLATMSGYGLDYTLIVQGIDQLRALYDKDAGTILNNCAYKWYCNVTDVDSAKHLSDSLGEATVRTTGKSQSTGTAGGGGSTSGESTTWGEKGRKLLTPDEVINLGRDVAIAFQPEGLPMYLKPVDYWNLHRDFAHIAAMDDWQDLFWKPPLAWDANPYVKGVKAAGA